MYFSFNSLSISSSRFAKLKFNKKLPSKFAGIFKDFDKIGETIHLKTSLKSKTFYKKNNYKKRKSNTLELSILYLNLLFRASWALCMIYTLFKYAIIEILNVILKSSYSKP